ncbi:hypothetical protein H6F50_23460 [Coleofasciculus sp. FACHB-712]|uniref:hypothetical protein n=1 Tax=unclassified Coleofasciculus TaxID=2692782 RepID=UPI001681EAE7|nr:MULTISPECIES: hypothetical protein [unclassified Coleofasciculus]MBD1945272.1 hypothetical protein [Coleofasciculus sp. FACHB-712]MBD2083380.1 hypothetical protein [Coleofasciculus sp. FACHB-542]
MNDLGGVGGEFNEVIAIRRLRGSAIALNSSRRQIHLFNYGLPPYLKPLISLQ